MFAFRGILPWLRAMTGIAVCRLPFRLYLHLFKNMGRLGPYVLVQQRLLPILLIGSVLPC